MSESDFDILIVGGGLVGASLAVALEQIPLRVGVIESASPLGQQPADERAFALSFGSRRIFEGLGLWSELQSHATPIRSIHVSDRGHFGKTRLEAADEGVEALGYVIRAQGLTAVLGEALSRLKNVTLICPARIQSLDLTGASARVTVEAEGRERRLSASLVVAADGDRSRVRELMGAQTWRVGYDQTAVVATVRGDHPHGDTAFERFTDSGPLALLPLGGGGGADGEHQWALVWTVHDRDRDAVLGLDEGRFLARLQERFGYRAGRFLSCGPRSAFPLGLRYVRQPVRQRLVFIGNAAHTVHPIAGQGFNLGLRDVAALAEVLEQIHRAKGDLGAIDNLQAYGEWRRLDYLRVFALTDGLVRLFSNDRLPFVLGRNLGMVGVDLLAPVRRLLSRQTMGLTGRLPHLARGAPLGREGE